MSSLKKNIKNSLFCISLLSVILSFSSCNEESENAFAFSLQAQPQRIHAPGNVHFSYTFEDDPPPSHCSVSWDFGDGVTLNGLEECDHNYTKSGDFEVKTTIQCDEGISIQTKTIVVYPSPDLIVSAAEARPLEITTGSSLQVQFQLMNAKSAVKLATSIELFLVPSKNPADFVRQDATRIHKYSLSDFPDANEKDSVQTLSFDVPITSKIPTGSYYLAVYADPDDLIGETDETNNLTFSSATVLVRNQKTDGADLIANSLSVSPLSTRLLSSFTANFDILNSGSTAAIDFEYQLLLGQNGNDHDYQTASLLMTGELNGAVSGQITSVKDLPVQVSPALDTSGYYYVWLVLDPNNILDEHDETNNIVRSSSPIVITNDPILDADIIIKSIEIAPLIAYQLGSFNTTLELYNQGSQPTGSFICSIYLSEDQALQPEKDYLVSTLNVSNLQSNAEHAFEATSEIPPSIKEGKYWVYTYCDSSGVVTEANEDNNTQRSVTQITIVNDGNVDLIIRDAEILSGKNHPSGSPFSLKANICNNGGTGAGPSTYTIERKNLCNQTTTNLTKNGLPSLEARACTLVSFEESMDCDFWCDQYEITLSVDVMNVLHETNEDNNSIALGNGFSISGDSCKCMPDSCEENNAFGKACKLTAGSHELTLCQGDEDWFAINVLENQSIEVHISHQNSRGKLHSELWNAAEKLTERSQTDNLYHTSYLSNATRTFFIHVIPEAPNQTNSYTLDVKVYDRPENLDIAIGDLQIQDNALNTTDLKTVNYTLYDVGQKTPNNSFNVAFYANTSSIVDENAILLAKHTYSSFNGNTSLNDSVNLKLPTSVHPGTWQLIAVADADNALDEGNKSNNIARSQPWKIEQDCWDALDPNDQLSEAKVIEFITSSNTLSYMYEDLRVCKVNPDFYQFTIPNGYNLSITANLLSGNGDFDLKLYDAKGTLIDIAATASSTESIHQDIIVGTQTFYLEVFQLPNPYNPDESSYSLSITSSKVKEYLLCDDSFEPNNNIPFAYPLLNAAFSGKDTALCPASDEDYYQISLTQGRRLQLKFNTQSTTLRTALYNSEGSLVALLSNLLTQSFDYTAPEDGDYYVRVYTNTPDIHSQAYSLTLSDFGSDDLAVSELTITPQNPVAGDTILVSFKVTNNGEKVVKSFRYTITAESHPELVTLDTQQYTLELPPAGETIIQNKVDLPHNLSSETQLKVAIESDSIEDSYLQNNTTSLDLNIAPACLNDGFEPNDFQALANKISGLITAKICDGDKDWYAWAPPKSGTATITLSFNNADGDLDLYLYDSTQTLLQSSRTSADEEKITQGVLYGKTYYVLVESFDKNVKNTYTLNPKL